MRKTSVLLITSLLMGCQAREARMTAKPLEAQPLKVFAFENQDLRYNRVFLWKNGVTGEQVNAVLRNSENIDVLEGKYIGLKNHLEALQAELQKNLDVLQSQDAELWAQMSASIADSAESVIKQTKRLELKKKDLSTTTDKVTAATSIVSGIETQALAIKTELDKELAKPESEQDKEKIKTLTTALEAKTAEKTAAQADLDSLKQKLTQIQTAITSLETGIEEAKQSNTQSVKEREEKFPSLSKKDGEIQDVTKKIEKHQDESAPKLEKYLSQVVENVDEFSEIGSVKVKKDGGLIAVEIQGWQMGSGGVRDFSTSAGDVRNVKYTDLGGKVEFDVKIDEQTSYNFKMARTRYADPGGRIIYQGDLKCVRNGETRLGVAKFIDRNLN